MRSDWSIVELGSCLRVKHGFAFRGEHFGESGDFIVLTPGNFYDEGGFKPKDGAEKFYAAQPPADYVLKRNDLVLAMTEQVQGLLGSSALIPCDDVYLHNQRIGLVELKPDIDRRFIYNLFNTSLVRDQIQATATGSKVRHTAPSRIEAVKVPLPPLETQRKIGAILSHYDDLIENNRHRIELLEEMALRIYREWFVELRYPGHDGVELVASELGQIPSGWEVVSLGSKFSVVLGGTPSRKRPEYWTNGTVPWINSGRVNDRRIIEPTEMITETALRSSNAELMPKRSTVVAITGATLGQVSYLEIDASANQSVVGITDTSGGDCEWLFLTVKSGIERLVGAASGGAQQHINKSVVSEFRVVLPDSDVRQRFASVTQPMFECIANLLKANRGLRATRDLLLPRLMAGDIEVDDLDIPVEEVAA